MTIVSMIRVAANWHNEGTKQEVHKIGRIVPTCPNHQNLGRLCASSRVLHFTFSRFDGMGVFAETVLVTDKLQTGITLLTRARTIARSVIETAIGWSGRCGAAVSSSQGVKATQLQQED